MQPLPLPNQTAVSVTVESLPDSSERLAAWNATQQRLLANPIHGGGRRFSRDELRERR